MNRVKSLLSLTLMVLVLTACMMPPPPPQGQGALIDQNQPPANQGSGVQDPAQNQNNVPQSQVNPSPDNSSVQADASAPHTSEVDITHIELGDGKYSQSPQVGYVYSCQTQFNFNGKGGQGENGNWLNGDGTWDATKKAVVSGAVSWPHSFTITLQGEQRVFSGNDLPNHTTGVYPISSSDAAYTYDRNPGSISAQTVQFAVPANPQAAISPNCVGGEVGIMLSGVVIFSAFDAEGRDAPAHEVQDSCDGHPQNTGFYHYHNLSDCLEDNATGHSALMGYAFDGYGIYGYYGEDGKELTNADLDVCHGHTHTVLWDGQTVEMYHYHATHQFPYVVGCFHGSPAVRALSVGGQGGQQGGPQPQGQTGNQQGGTPPQEALDVCVGKSQGDACSFGPVTGSCMTPPNTSQLACVPGAKP
jgi:hypothetical protein